MEEDLEISLSYFDDRLSISYNDIPIIEMPLFQKCMELLVDVGYVSVHRTRNGLISIVRLNELGQQKYVKLVSSNEDRCT